MHKSKGCSKVPGQRTILTMELLTAERCNQGIARVNLSTNVQKRPSDSDDCRFILGFGLQCCGVQQYQWLGATEGRVACFACFYYNLLLVRLCLNV